MRRQRDAAFTDEIIVSHAKEKTVNPIVTGQKNVGQLGNNRACGDGSIDVKERHINLLIGSPMSHYILWFCRHVSACERG